MLNTTVAGRYEIEAQIGVGGMGIVYRARDTRLRRDVALKVIAPHLMTQEAARVRFLREAQALAGLTHPNIVTIFDMAEDADANTVFLVMELLSGHTLRRFLQDGTCPPTPECPPFSAVVPPLCRALEAAHKRGVLHRDIKPENIFLCDDGTLKLMDFGLARLLGDMSKNQSSAVAGTLAYMAPEQLRGEKLDARADLYALGVVCFEFVTGAQPFTGDNPGTVLLKHLTEPPPALRERLPLPTNPNAREALDALEALIARMMAKEAEQRPASAAEVRGVLEQELTNGDTLAVGVDRLLVTTRQADTGAGGTVTSFLPSAPLSVPTANLAALLAARPTETGLAAASSGTPTSAATDAPPVVSATAVSTAHATTAGIPSGADGLPASASGEPIAPVATSHSPAWKTRAGIVAGVGVLGVASALAVVQLRLHATITPAPSLPAAALSHKTRGTITTAVTSPKSLPSARPKTSLPTSSAVASPATTAPGVGGKGAGTMSAQQSDKLKPSSPSNEDVSRAQHANDAEREAWRRQQQEELALIKTLKQELEMARAVRNTSVPGAKTHAPAPSVTASTPNSAKTSPKSAGLPALPNVADEATPPLAIGMKVARVQRSDAETIHVSLQNDVDCYAYFYLLPPRTREAVRLFSGYENFPASPKTAYSLRMLVPKDVANNRGAVLMIATKKELKNLPASFELPPPQPLAITSEASPEQRQQIVRQNIHQFSDQIAQKLAENRVLLGGQLMQPHDVLIRLLGSNPMVFGRNPDGSRRPPGRPPNRTRRNFPPAAE